jgi:hypothetical protein
VCVCVCERMTTCAAFPRYCFCLTKLSIAEIIQRGNTGCSVNNNFKIIFKEAVVA